MTVTLIGVIAFLIGLYGLCRSDTMRLAAFAVSLLFGAAAGIILDNFGGVNLLLGHIMLGFLVIATLGSPRSLRNGFAALAPGRAGYWLALICAYGALSAIFMPRLFAGATMVYAVSRGGDASLGPVVLPLGPVSGNLSQTFYLLSDLVCFFVCSAATSTRDGFRALAIAMLACAALNVGFGVLDYATFAAGQADALAFMRNATYRMLDDAEILGYKRIVGSFSEASAFATVTLTFFAFSARLAVLGRYVAFTAPLAVASSLAIVAATSTTGYVGYAVCLIALFLITAWDATRRSCSLAGLTFLLTGPLLIGAIVLALMLQGSIWDEAVRVANETIVAKASSSSGQERGAWNALALQSFSDTYYLGAGVGSVRSASFLVAILASVGAPGALLFAPFLYHVLGKPIAAAEPDPLRRDIRMAARFACFALLVAATLAGVFIDLGLQFFVFASLCTAVERDEASAAVPSRTRALAGFRGEPRYT